MAKFYTWILNLIKPVIIYLGSLHSPWSRKKITGKFYYKVRDIIEPGTVLLTTTYGEFSNLLNPLDIKHAAIYIGRDSKGICYVTEAVGSGVILTDLVSFLLTKDVVIGVKPKFLAVKDKGLLFEEAKKFIGIPYDFSFKIGNKALYCFENVIAVFKALRPELDYKRNDIVKGKSIYDHNTFLSDKYLFTVLFDSREMEL